MSILKWKIRFKGILERKPHALLIFHVSTIDAFVVRLLNVLCQMEATCLADLSCIYNRCLCCAPAKRIMSNALHILSRNIRHALEQNPGFWSLLRFRCAISDNGQPERGSAQNVSRSARCFQPAFLKVLSWRADERSPEFLSA